MRFFSDAQGLPSCSPGALQAASARAPQILAVNLIFCAPGTSLISSRAAAAQCRWVMRAPQQPGAPRAARAAFIVSGLAKCDRQGLFLGGNAITNVTPTVDQNRRFGATRSRNRATKIQKITFFLWFFLVIRVHLSYTKRLNTHRHLEFCRPRLVNPAL